MKRAVGPACLAVVALFLVGDVGLARGQDLTYEEFQAATRAAHRLDHLALLVPPDRDIGLYLYVGDRYGLVHAYYLTHQSSEEIWKSKQLEGIVDEVLIGDLDGDGYEDALVARTNAAKIYIWGLEDYNLAYETLTSEFEKINAFTLGNVDEDEQLEIIVNADMHIHYIDGVLHNREWTSLHDYEATRMACGDVDGDRNNEIVLNTGQVVDSRSGDLKWDEEVFGSRIELVDMDGDGIVEVLTESDGIYLKIFDVDHKKEKHLQ
jgi:hypothetical protein